MLPEKKAAGEPILSAFALGPYLLEIHEIADSLLFQLQQIEDAAGRVIKAREAAESAERVGPARFDQELFAAALNTQGRAQNDLFAAIESFLAAWARLSLLFFPAARPGSFAAIRGELLVEVFDLPADSPIRDRRLRDSWMHFDERLDTMIAHTAWRSRHRFVLSADVRDNEQALRVVEIDTLRVHYRGRDLERRVVNLRSLRLVIEDLLKREQHALVRYRQLYPSLPDAAAV